MLTLETQKIKGGDDKELTYHFNAVLSNLTFFWDGQLERGNFKATQSHT